MTFKTDTIKIHTMFENSKAFSGYSVDDLTKAKRFYNETLGLKVEDNPMGLIELHLKGGNVVFLYPKENHQPATFTVLNFPVKHIDAAVDALIVKGVKMERYDGFDHDEKGVVRSDGQGPSIAWFKDPAGNILSVIEDPDQ